MTAKEITIDFIRDYCIKNNQQAWYNALIAQKIQIKTFPKVRNAEGKLVADKSAEPRIKEGKITFVQIKKEFIAKFFPELKAKEKAAAKMYQPL